MDYKVLDKTTQATAVEGRIRDLERQHLEVSLRVDAPSLGEGANDFDAANLERLTESLNKLYAMRDTLKSAGATPPNANQGLAQANAAKTP